MTDEIIFDEQLRMEQEGVYAELNPMFGEWQQTFKFAPVPYGDGGAERQAFREAMQLELTNRWIYSNEIQIEITLHLDVQSVLETSATADLDNYAKAILDGLKGPDGIMIDDTQAQALAISWLDGYDDSSFTVSAKSMPDEFMLKPIEFYEMPDGLWYPQRRLVWSAGEKESMSEREHFAGLSITEMMSSIKTRARAEMRKAGLDRLRSYQRSKYVSSSARGFHRSRIESGFAIHSRKVWQEMRQKWKEANASEFEAVEQTIEKMRASYEVMIDLLSGRMPSADDPRIRGD